MQGNICFNKEGNNFHIQQKEDTLHEGYTKISQEKLAKSRHNKHVAGKKGVSPGWIMNLYDQISV